jgi:hemolysin III
LIALLIIGWGTPAKVISLVIYGVSVIFLFSASATYHMVRVKDKALEIFRKIDHAAIYLLIAGTYTPFALGVLRGSWGWTLLVLVWSLALAGVLLKATGNMRHPVLSTSLYLGMGWLVIVAFKPLCIHVPAWGLFWLLAGGIGYTVGIGFFAAVRLRHSHFIWHLFVIAGTACHFIAVLRFAF